MSGKLTNLFWDRFFHLVGNLSRLLKPLFHRQLKGLPYFGIVTV
mgnify:FL=1